MGEAILYNGIVGNDNGNSEHDIIIDGVQICQPNVYAKVKKLPLLDEVSVSYVIRNIHDNLLVSINSPYCSTGNYYVGKKALESGLKVRSIEVGSDNSKVDSELVVINTLAQVAAHYVKRTFEEKGNLNDPIKVVIDMATALPISQYSKTMAERFSKKFTDPEKFKNDISNVTVHVGVIRANVEVKFDFTKTIPEGVTAVHAIQNANDDLFAEYNSKEKENKNKIKLSREFFKKKKILHIAIGEGTTELPITDDINFNPDFIKGTNNGIGIAIDNVLDEFKNEIGVLTMSRQKFSSILRDKAHKYHDLAEEIIEDEIETQAEEILHAAKGEIEKANNEVDIIVVYGGGSISMRKYLEPKLINLCNKTSMLLFYVPESYAVTIESEGLSHFAKSKLFSKLKELNKKVN